MTEAELALGLVRSKSEETEIPFAKLASAFMLEEVLFILAGSFAKDRFLLRDPDAFSLQSYRERLLHTLKLYDTASFDEKDLKSIFHRMLEKETESGITWHLEMKRTDNALIFYCTGSLCNLIVPFEILVKKLPPESVSEEKTFRLFFYPDRRFQMQVFSAEQVICEALMDILTKLELIRELELYETVYRILKSESMNGRHMMTRLKAKLEAHHITPDERRMELLQGYRTQPFMKKKWKQYLKSRKKEEPLWEDMIDAICAFLSPLWDCLCRDEVFFGDWMPDLMRYLM